MYPYTYHFSNKQIEFFDPNVIRNDRLVSRTSQQSVSARCWRKAEGKSVTCRLMAAINWKDESDATRKEIANRYGNSQGWFSQWRQRFERLK